MRADKMDRVVVQTMLTTLGSILLLSVLAFAIVALLFPSTLIRVSYQLGNDSGAMKYANRAYKTSGDVYYIAYATEVAIGIDKNEDIEEYAQEFIANENGFNEYCRQVDERRTDVSELGSYRQRVYGYLVLAEYAQGKSDEALAHAKEAIGEGFPYNNAYVALFFAALQEEDDELLEKLLQGMREATPSNDADKTYLDEILAAYEKFLPKS